MDQKYFFRNSKKIFFIFILIFCSSCGKDISNRASIAHYGSNFKLYKENMLELKIPNDITEHVYMMHWKCIPQGSCNVSYERNTRDEFVFKKDRVAVVVPLLRGEVQIKVSCKDKNGKKYVIAERKFNVK